MKVEKYSREKGERKRQERREEKRVGLLFLGSISSCRLMASVSLNAFSGLKHTNGLLGWEEFTSWMSLSQQKDFLQNMGPHMIT